MLKKRDYLMIQDKLKQGMYLKDIAAALGVHPKTVRRALQRGGAPRGRWPKRGRVLDAFTPQIDALLASAALGLPARHISAVASGSCPLATLLRPCRASLHATSRDAGPFVDVVHRTYISQRG